MEILTKNSPKEELVKGLTQVIMAIQALKLIEELGLGSRSISDAIEDLKVYEKQLVSYLWNKY